MIQEQKQFLYQWLSGPMTISLQHMISSTLNFSRKRIWIACFFENYGQKFWNAYCTSRELRWEYNVTRQSVLLQNYDTLQIEPSFILSRRIASSTPSDFNLILYPITSINRLHRTASHQTFCRTADTTVLPWWKESERGVIKAVCNILCMKSQGSAPQIAYKRTYAAYVHLHCHVNVLLGSTYATLSRTWTWELKVGQRGKYSAARIFKFKTSADVASIFKSFTKHCVNVKTIWLQNLSE